MQYPTLQQLLEAGVHFGHQVRRGNPKMRQYIYGAKEGVHIIDLTLSEAKLKEACEYVKDLGKQGGMLLVVGTKKQARPIVEELAEKTGAYYITERWIGGFLTNFEEISKNIKKLKELKVQKEKGELSKYTKKEQLLLDRKMIKLERDFKGVLEMSKVPEAIFIVDAASDDIAAKESIRTGVKVVAIADSNSDPSLMDFPVPGNDDAIKSIRILTEAIITSYEEGKKQLSENNERAIKKEQEKKDLEVAIPEEDIAIAEEEIEKKTLKDSERVV